MENQKSSSPILLSIIIFIMFTTTTSAGYRSFHKTPDQPTDVSPLMHTLAAPSPPAFNHYTLSQQWPSGVCKDPSNKCISTIPKIFTVHGLWPSNKAYPHPSRCSTVKLNATDITILGPILTVPWPSVLSNVNDEQFWRHEWNTHGTCSTFQKLDYFKHTIGLWAKDNITSFLEQDNIRPGGSYDKQLIIDAIQKKTLAPPQLSCVAGNYLAEIHLCLDPSTASKYIACPPPPPPPLPVSKTACPPMVHFAA